MFFIQPTSTISPAILTRLLSGRLASSEDTLNVQDVSACDIATYLETS